METGKKERGWKEQEKEREKIKRNVDMWRKNENVKKRMNVREDERKRERQLNKKIKY